MDTITITRKEFRDAVLKAMQKISSDDKLGSKAQFLISLTGMTFASDVEEILFGEETEG